MRNYCTRCGIKITTPTKQKIYCKECTRKWTYHDRNRINNIMKNQLIKHGITPKKR